MFGSDDCLDQIFPGGIFLSWTSLFGILGATGIADLLEFETAL